MIFWEILETHVGSCMECGRKSIAKNPHRRKVVHLSLVVVERTIAEMTEGFWSVIVIGSALVHPIVLRRTEHSPRQIPFLSTKGAR